MKDLTNKIIFNIFYMKLELENTIPFTLNDIKNKDLVIEMLKEETKISFDNDYQDKYHDKFFRPYISLDINLLIVRVVLNKFGFNTSDESIENYRSIFKYYYKNPNEYDYDVIQSSHYMKNNRVLFYKTKPLNIDDTIPNVNLLNLDSTKTNLYDIINQNKSDYTIIASFSMS